jgi:transketolase
MKANASGCGERPVGEATRAPFSNIGPAIAEVRRRAYEIRRRSLQMAAVQGQGYVGQALGIADVLAVAYFHALSYRPADPKWEARDRFFLSIGHYAIALYAALIEIGVLPEGEWETYGSDDSRLPMSAMSSYTPGVEITGGSLGHGMSIAVGACLALKRKRSAAFVYVLVSDGELNEGSIWEAALSASHWRLDNLIVIVDLNNQQADGPAERVLSLEPVAAKWEAFGWFAQRVDGNDVEALIPAFDRARHFAGPRPRVILCDTLMGKGVAFLEGREKTHFIRVEPDEWSLALRQLSAGEAA